MQEIMMEKRILIFVLLLGSLALAMSNGAPALDCAQCHIGAAQHPPKFKVIGLPKYYEPGKVYNITIEITKGPPCKGGVACGGFAVSVSGGKLIVTDPKDTFLTTDLFGHEILTHTSQGALKRKWSFAWKAPTKPKPVIFSIAVNAVNGDGSNMGDSYGFTQVTILPKGWKNATVVTVTITVTKYIGFADVGTIVMILVLVAAVAGGMYVLRKL
ncbi:hypothetical protein IPA_08080 [Ignicoccus pacificus DSM 13166]|uniref:Reelin domain-containing protein n=1 Tax=Ignicoccus pacificus DSM 13166 TaxID=940294 RepID=A0A977KBV8_9CREN|nr:hypothetical protein IPA_08080 [Ignicoccus pacificus DSM 13166]